MKDKSLTRWGIIWRSQNRRDGKVEQWVYENAFPLLLRTREEARERAEEMYGYIRKRPDLMAEPHGWKMPKVAKVRVTLRAC